MEAEVSGYRTLWFPLFLAAFWSFGAFAADLPTPTLTPGDALNVTAADICNPGYAKAARNVSASLKTAVYRGDVPPIVENRVAGVIG